MHRRLQVHDRAQWDWEDAEASGGVSVRDMRYPSDTQGWQCIWVDTYCQNAGEREAVLCG